VIAVEFSKMAGKLREMIKRNSLEKIITVVEARLEEADLCIPNNSVDLIISEWMGYTLFYERMFDSVIFARDKYLKIGGHMIPD
jgi:hypothetical protein